MVTVNKSSPEYLGWQSAQPSWRAVLRNPFTCPVLRARWQRARDVTLGIDRVKDQRLSDRDATVERLSKRHQYD